MKCYDCGSETARRNIQMTTVHVEHEERPGYERVPVPLCRGCRLQRVGTPCAKCGEMYRDQMDAWRCENPEFPGGCNRGGAA